MISVMPIGKSELLFEQYLNSLGYQEGEHFEYEPDLGKSKRPDYILNTKSFN